MVNGNLTANWKLFKQRFNIYMTASGASEKADNIKTNIFLHVVGQSGLELYNTLTFDKEGDELKLKEVLKKFEAHCSPKTNEVVERYKFNQCIQEPNESVDLFITNLKTLARSCEFEDAKDSLIRDRIVFGLRKDDLGNRMR